MLAAAAVAAVGCGDSPKPGLTLTPSSPGQTSGLRFKFTAPDSSGRGGGVQKGYTLSMSGPVRRGCASLRADQLPAITKGENVNVTIRPPAHAHWCTGAFTARVQELARPVCTPGTACPQFVRLAASVGRVHFRILR